MADSMETSSEPQGRCDNAEFGGVSCWLVFCTLDGLDGMSMERVGGRFIPDTTMQSSAITAIICTHAKDFISSLGNFRKKEGREEGGRFGGLH